MTTSNYLLHPPNTWEKGACLRMKCDLSWQWQLNKQPIKNAQVYVTYVIDYKHTSLSWNEVIKKHPQVFSNGVEVWCFRQGTQQVNAYHAFEMIFCIENATIILVNLTIRDNRNRVQCSRHFHQLWFQFLTLLTYEWLELTSWYIFGQ